MYNSTIVIIAYNKVDLFTCATRLNLGDFMCLLMTSTLGLQECHHLHGRGNLRFQAVFLVSPPTLHSRFLDLPKNPATWPLSSALLSRIGTDSIAVGERNRIVAITMEFGLRHVTIILPKGHFPLLEQSVLLFV